MGHDVEMLPASDYLAMMKQANPGFDAQGGAIDWSGQAVRTAITHSHHISVSGAKDRTPATTSRWGTAAIRASSGAPIRAS